MQMEHSAAAHDNLQIKIVKGSLTDWIALQQVTKQQ